MHSIYIPMTKLQLVAIISIKLSEVVACCKLCCAKAFSTQVISFVCTMSCMSS